MFKQQFLENLTLRHRMLIVFVCAAAYLASFTLNEVLFEDLLFSQRVHWIYLPSGIRLLAVLVFFEWGAVGIFMGSLAINYLHFAHESHTFILGISTIVAVTPLLARRWSVEWFNLSHNLDGLTSAIILKMTVLFSVLSSALIQVWLCWNGQTDDFITPTAVRSMGQFLGTALVLMTASVILKSIKRSLQRG